MAGVIATLLTDPKTIDIATEGQKGPSRHVYKELTDLQTINDPDLASPYLKASNVNTILAHAADAVSGNFTITLNFPNYDVNVTTGNIIYNAAEATIQSAVDTALSGSVIVGTYSAGDVDVALTQNLNDTVNSAVVTVNGTTVNGAYCEVTTANVDLGADVLNAVMMTANGTMDRPAEAILTLFGAITLTGTVTAQGLVPESGVYSESGDIVTLSPGLQEALVTELTVNENASLGDHIRDIIGCV